MKKLFALILFLPLIIVAQHANFNRLFVGGAAESGGTSPQPSGACTNIAASLETGSDSIGWGQETDNLLMASRASVPNTTNVCSVALYLDRVFTPTDTLKIGLWSWDSEANIPGVQIGSYSENWAPPTVGGWYTFTNLNWAMTGGSNYCIVIGRSELSTVNYYGMALGDGNGVWANRTAGWQIYYSRNNKAFFHKFYTQ